MNGEVLRNSGGASDFDLPSVVAAAHELKSPLALLRQLALSLEQSDTLANTQITARRIELSAERALRLVDDLTQAHQLNLDYVELEPVNTVALCDEIVSEIQPLFAAHNRTIRVRRRRQAPLVVANRTLLRRVLMNFADNALHYAYENPVIIETTLHNGAIRISVRDHGPGVSSKLRQTLKPQAKPTLSRPARRPNSSGLGLYLAKQFATAMQGNVGVINHRDGASFYIELSGSTQLSWL